MGAVNGPLAGRFGREEPGLLFWSLSRLSLMGLISAYSSAKVSPGSLGETCKYEELTCLSPYIPHCVSKGPETSWVPYSFSHRSPVLATPG